MIGNAPFEIVAELGNSLGCPVLVGVRIGDAMIFTDYTGQETYGSPTSKATMSTVARCWSPLRHASAAENSRAARRLGCSRRRATTHSPCPADLAHHAGDGHLSRLPEQVRDHPPRHKTPSFATVAAGIGAAVFYSVLTFLSERVLTDTIYSLGIMICFYYGLTAFACIYFFRRELFQDFSSFVFKLLFACWAGSDSPGCSW